MTFLYWWRLIVLLIQQWFKPSIPFRGQLDLNFRVKLSDCDGVRYLAGCMYPVYMDFARWALIARTGVMEPALKKGWTPVLGGQKLIYKKPLKRWEKFQLSISYAGWDERWVYNLHTFKKEGKVVAIGVTRGMLWSSGAPVSILEILKLVGEPPQELPPPKWITEAFAHDSEVAKSY